MHPPEPMPLTSVPAGRWVVLRRARTECGLTARLAAMGLLPGVKVRVCRNDRHGPVVLGIEGSRVMLGRGMADKVWVQEAGGGPGEGPGGCAETRTDPG